MGYGETYSRKPTKEKKSQEDSLISCLCNEVGYNREDLENIELETKIDLSYSASQRKSGITLTFGEDLDFIEPYSRDKILESSKANHSCYAFVDKERNLLIPAFTKVEGGKNVKIKVKGKTQQIKNEGIILLKRDEKHFEDLTAIEINKYIAETARKNKLPLEYVGRFIKESKETFVFNPTSGRIFVIATNICTMKNSQLCQLEAEYYGQINGFNASKNVESDLVNVIKGILEKIPRKYHAKTSKLTKFDWLVQNIR